MANVYVRSGAAGAGTGADWANAYTTLTAAIVGKAAGDVFYVSEDHAESTAGAVTLTFPGTDASPNQVYCVNHAGSVPPVSADLATTGTVSTTGANSITLAGTVSECNGLSFIAGDAANSGSVRVNTTNAGTWKLRNCKLQLRGSSVTARINLGSSGDATHVELYNTTLQFASASQFCQIIGRTAWYNTASAIAGATLPTILFKFFVGAGGSMWAEGVDLSALGSGKTIIDPTVGGGTGGQFVLKDCKLGASVTIASAPTGFGQAPTYVIRSDSGSTNYRQEAYTYTGTLTAETTIVRTGGASDGSTPISWKIVTTANSKRTFPFECLPISIWNETTGSAITLTVEGIWGGGAVPTNADIWMDAEYLGTSGFPLGNFTTSGTADQLAAGSNLTSSTETWGGSTTKFKMSVTITPQKKGPITVYVKAALASSTFYVDPKITVA